jgi:hypothetical protein
MAPTCAVAGDVAQGREIGDSIFVAELLGSALAAEQLPGAAVILDIAKA